MLVKDVMSQKCYCVNEGEPVARAAELMREHEIGAVPICGEDERLKGILTDRDIVVSVIAQGKDPQELLVNQLEQGKPFTIAADASLEDAVSLMEEHSIRRLPVVNNDKKLCGMISEGDLAKAMDYDQSGDLLAHIAAAPDNSGVEMPTFAR